MENEGIISTCDEVMNFLSSITLSWTHPHCCCYIRELAHLFIFFPSVFLCLTGCQEGGIQKTEMNTRQPWLGRECGQREVQSESFTVTKMGSAGNKH